MAASYFSTTPRIAREPSSDRRTAEPGPLPSPRGAVSGYRNPYFLGGAYRPLCLQDQEADELRFSRLHRAERPRALLQGRAAPQPAPDSGPLPGSTADQWQRRYATTRRQWPGHRIRPENASIPAKPATQRRASTRRTERGAYRRPGQTDRRLPRLDPSRRNQPCTVHI